METMFRALYLFAAKENVEHQTMGVRTPRFLGLRNLRYGTRPHFLFIRGDGMTLSAIGTSAISGPIVPAPDDQQLVDWEFTGDTDVLEEILPQSHFVHYGSHTTGTETGPPRWEAGD
jgi:hypothetical protein